MPIETLGSHQAAYDAVFQHPIAHNLQWKDLRAMLIAISDTTEDHDDKMKFSRNGLTLTVHPPKHKDFSDVGELMKVRHFLDGWKTPEVASNDGGSTMSVVINHREARIFKSDRHGSVPERIVPLDADGTHRYLHNVDNGDNGQRKPENAAFYNAVAKALAPATQILILGSSTGASSAMDHLVAELKRLHPGVAERIAGTLVVNEPHMSDDQLLAEVRSFQAPKHA